MLPTNAICDNGKYCEKKMDETKLIKKKKKKKKKNFKGLQLNKTYQKEDCEKVIREMSVIVRLKAVFGHKVSCRCCRKNCSKKTIHKEHKRRRERILH